MERPLVSARAAAAGGFAGADLGLVAGALWFFGALASTGALSRWGASALNGALSAT
jgi:hypothetical protein